MDASKLPDATDDTDAAPAAGTDDTKPHDQNPASVDTTRAGSSSHSPKAPHERDASVGMTDGKPDATIRQGAQDVKRGLTDTTRGNESDATYQKQK